MTYASETSIQLESEETERIIPPDGANRPYIIEVLSENPVRIDHREQYALDGTTLGGNQVHKISTLRGEELYAAAHEGPAEIRVREASADVESQPEREVRVVNADTLELAAAVGITDTEGTQIDPATAGGIRAELEPVLSDPLPREITSLPAVAVEDTDGNEITPATADAQGNYPDGYDNQFTPDDTTVTSLTSGPVPDGVEVAVQATKDNTDPVQIGISPTPVMELSPGQVYTTQVQDREQIRIQVNTVGDSVNVSHEAR